MLQQPKKPSVPPFNLEKVTASVNEDEQSDLVQQYLQETDKGNSMDCFLTIYLHCITSVFYTYIAN